MIIGINTIDSIKGINAKRLSVMGSLFYYRLKVKFDETKLPVVVPFVFCQILFKRNQYNER
jgi:hypothetical protein